VQLSSRLSAWHYPQIGLWNLLRKTLDGAGLNGGFGKSIHIFYTKVFVQ
jgi:hypothetical protein